MSSPLKEVYTPPTQEKALKTTSVRAVKEKLVQETPGHLTFSDFRLYKCDVCGKMVMGFEKEEYVSEKHGGKVIGWRKKR